MKTQNEKNAQAAHHHISLHMYSKLQLSRFPRFGVGALTEKHTHFLFYLCDF
jgi:hypothetical protein